MRTLTQEFLILPWGDGVVAVYRPSTIPRRTPIGRDARRLRVLGPSRVEIPAEILSEADLERWTRKLAEDGNDVSTGPFWRSGIDPSQVDLSDPSQFIPAKEAFDELLREAEARGRAGHQRPEPTARRHP